MECPFEIMEICCLLGAVTIEQESRAVAGERLKRLRENIMGS